MNSPDHSDILAKRLDGSVEHIGRSFSSTFITIACYFGLAVANLYGFSMIATGLINANLLPENAVFGGFGRFLSYLVAMFVQIGIFLIYLSWPLRTKGKYFLNWTTNFMWLALVLLATLFSIFSITLSSRGDELVRFNNESVSAIDTRIKNLDSRITQIYDSQIQNLDRMHSEACSGKDRTGIAVCGPIAKGYQDRRQETIAKYGAYLSENNFAEPVEGQSHSGTIQVLNGNLETLRAKNAFFDKFANANDVNSNSIRQQFDTIETQLAAVSSQIGSDALGKNEIAFRQVFSDISDAWSLSAGWQFWVALAIASLPDVMSIVFILVLLIVKEANDLERVIKEDINQAERLRKMYREGASVIKEKADAFRDWAWARRSSNMEEAADAKIADEI